MRHWIIGIVVLCVSWLTLEGNALAEAIDAYVAKYLDVADPVALDVDASGTTELFSAQNLSEGKRLFEENCINCHVGGATLPDPTVSLALDALRGATPPRDTVDGIVTFLRQPMTYDGLDETFWCRQVPESWMSDEELANLAAFVLRAAQKAPGWGSRRL
jgi:photosystem II cytochrome c550